MYATLTIGLLLGLVALYIFKRITHPLRHIPGPPQYPAVGCLPYIDHVYYHQSVTAWNKLYGPVIKVVLPYGDQVVVGDYKAIHEVTVTSGKQFAGRSVSFRLGYVNKHTGIVQNPPDPTWALLRKTSHKHLKQFGEGMSNIGDVVTEFAQGMFQEFQMSSGNPHDPRQVILDAALSTIVFLITGVRPKSGDRIMELMKEFEYKLKMYTGSDVTPWYMLFDVAPWTRYILQCFWSDIEQVVSLRQSIWEEVNVVLREHPEAKSLVPLLRQHTMDDVSDSEGKHKDVYLTDDDMKSTIVMLLFAGASTTAGSFYSAVNVLAHRPDVQNNIIKELSKARGSGSPITLEDRPNMPYTRAVILEALRYVSVVPLAINHHTLCDTQVNGFHIPKDTTIIVNLWALHHDPDFWENPYEFQPERFLDTTGELVPPDHPNRKHLMPFGAGPRVCVGESLALARLFLWMANLVQRFEVVPAEGNLASSADPRNFNYEGLLTPLPYKVVFSPRN